MLEMSLTMYEGASLGKYLKMYHCGLCSTIVQMYDLLGPLSTIAQGLSSMSWCQSLL